MMARRNETVSVNEADPARHGDHAMEVQRMRNDPVFKEIVGEAVAEQLRLERLREKGNNTNCRITVDHGNKQLVSNVNDNSRVKSPSDTTIYAPGLPVTSWCNGQSINYE